MPNVENPQSLTEAPRDFDDCCPNCGGEGYVSICFEEYACVDPEGGCDQCMRRCDWCRPSPAVRSSEASE